MKLDATDLRYVTSDEFRVLTAVEMGSKNHEVVPTPLIVQLSGLRSGGINKLLGSLAHRSLVSRVQNMKYDGYRLTYGGYDYLALRALSKRASINSIGNQIGIGKESDIYIVANDEGQEHVLKIHRLGRISFRTVKQNRDYMGNRKFASWMYMSRLAAQKEWAFMKVLHEHSFPVPKPVDQARHCIVMEFIDAYPLRQIDSVSSPGKLYSTLMDLIVRFARAGLIHGDFNEFNILIRRESGEPVVIDFPQMVSTSHENAEWYFNRDVECIRTFFRRKFQYDSTLYPRFRKVFPEERDGETFRLDVVVSASGFVRNEMKELEEYMHAVGAVGATPVDVGNEQEGEGEKGEEEEEEEEEEEAIVRDVGDQQSRERDERATTERTRTGKRRIFEEDEGHTKSPMVVKEDPRHHGVADPLNSVDDIGQRLASQEIKDRVSSELSKNRMRNQQQYHSRKSAKHAGRVKGSKAKQDVRVKVGAEW